MPRFTAILLAMATLGSTTAVLSAQAPIERAYPATPNNTATYPAPAAPQTPPSSFPTTTQPAQGIYLRVANGGSVQTISATNQKTELRVERGIANISVHDAAKDSLILIDLPGGQTQLLKNGFYTFNAGTNTARVLKGEALAFPAATSTAKPLKVKEDHAVSFTGTDIRSHEFYPFEASADLIPMPYPGGSEYPAGPPYGPYGDGFYGYPYFAFGYPWSWNYPYGWYPYPYPYIGLGFGYFGGFHGGFGRGFRR